MIFGSLTHQLGRRPQCGHVLFTAHALVPAIASSSVTPPSSPSLALMTILPPFSPPALDLSPASLPPQNLPVNLATAAPVISLDYASAFVSISVTAFISIGINQGSICIWTPKDMSSRLESASSKKELKDVASKIIELQRRRCFRRCLTIALTSSSSNGQPVFPIGSALLLTLFQRFGCGFCPPPQHFGLSPPNPPSYGQARPDQLSLDAFPKKSPQTGSKKPTWWGCAGSKESDQRVVDSVELN